MIEWHLLDLVSDPREDLKEGTEYALIILNQPLDDLDTLHRLWKRALLRVAADGGANRLGDARKQQQSATPEESGETYEDLDVIIGDLDSVTQETLQSFPRATVIRLPDQNSTDFGKAVEHIRSSNAERTLDIVAMGSVGGRVDQGLSQLHHLYIFQQDVNYADGRLYLVSNDSMSFLLKSGTHRIHVRREGETDRFDKYIGILPLGGPSVISTAGLEWDVKDWKTQFGGRISTSNHVLPTVSAVDVETTADVIFTIALKKD